MTTRMNKISDYLQQQNIKQQSFSTQSLACSLKLPIQHDTQSRANQALLIIIIMQRLTRRMSVIR